MSIFKSVTTTHYVNDNNAAQLSDDDLFVHLARGEQQLEKLKAIKTPSKKLSAQIEDIQSQLTQLAEYIDGFETGTYVAVYLNENKIEVTGAGSTRVKYNLQDADFIPAEVRTVVQDHFKHVFALAHGNKHPSPRAIYMQTAKPITVMVP